MPHLSLFCVPIHPRTHILFHESIPKIINCTNYHRFLKHAHLSVTTAESLRPAESLFHSRGRPAESRGCPTADALGTCGGRPMAEALGTCGGRPTPEALGTCRGCPTAEALCHSGGRPMAEALGTCGGRTTAEALFHSPPSVYHPHPRERAGFGFFSLPSSSFE